MSTSNTQTAPDMKVFWCVFIALITTSFGFIIRAFSIGDWGTEFGLTATQQGEILGVGVWPFAISIVVFSLIIDKIGYKTALGFAFVCHVLSVVLTITAKDYWTLYWATFIAALGAGTVEAVGNPVVASMFNKDKVKWLNIFHAGWPGGLALAGIIMIAMSSATWQTRMLLMLLPTLVYGILMISVKFPVNERVAAGVPYKDMLKEVGALGIFIVSWLIFSEVGRVFGWSQGLIWAAIAIVTIVYFAYVRSLGRPMFIFLLLIMMPLAITELATDGWVTELMGPEMHKIGLHAGWVIVYTSVIMVILRFLAGPIVKVLTPLGLLTICSGLAALGLFWLSTAQMGMMVLLAATLYGIAKSFFWPTMLGVVSERFPKGGALTLNATGGLGMLSAGIIGAVFLGLSQDKAIDKTVMHYDAANGTAIHDTYVTVDKVSVLGKYRAIDESKLAMAPEQDQNAIAEAKASSKKSALASMALLPIVMFLCYLILLLYFRAKGGYKPVDISAAQH